MYDGLNNNTNSGSYYDTNGGYIHYDSSENLNRPEKKKKGRFARTVAKCLVLALVFGCASSAAFMGTNYIGKQMFGDAVDPGTAKDGAGAEAGTPTTAVANSPSDIYDVSDIVQNCMPSVVSITNVGTTEFRTFFGTYEQESQSSGSGIIIGRNDTEIVIVTNNHVVSGAKEISVYFNSDGEDADEDNVISAKVKGTDPAKDLAVIAVQVSDIPKETLDMIKIAALGDSSTLEVGEPVVAIGNAYGYGLSVTSGIVSALNREVSVTSDGQTITNRLIQTDAAINPGNSGGALVDANGQLVGINTLITSYSGNYSGVGFAIPSNYAVGLAKDIIAGKEPTHAQLGVSLSNVNASIAERYGFSADAGAYVSAVVDGSGAANAGIQKGDIITAFDGLEVSSASDLMMDVRTKSPGDTVTVTVNRDGQTQDFQVTLGSDEASQKEKAAQQQQQQQQNSGRSSSGSGSSDPYGLFGF